MDEGKNGKLAKPPAKEGGNAKFTQVTFHLIPLKRAQKQRTTPTTLGSVSTETATSQKP